MGQNKIKKKRKKIVVPNCQNCQLYKEKTGFSHEKVTILFLDRIVFI